jgi:DNA-binding transcriptional LysR family regulator
MRNRFPALTALRAFEAAARLGSQRRAAEELCVDHTVVGKHIRKLEDDLGVRLLENTPAGARLTAAGSEYYLEVAQALDAIAAATERLRARRRHPTLHIACSPGLGARWLAPRIGGFLDQSPGLEITLHPTDRMPNLLAGEADVDVRSTDAPEAPGTRQLVLCRPRMYPVASPGFLARQRPVERVEDLLELPLCHEETHEYWRIWLRAAARLGHGVAIANDFIVADDLAAGRLVEVLPTSVHVYPYVLAAPRARWDDPMIALFRDWLVGQMVPRPAQ